MKQKSRSRSRGQKPEKKVEQLKNTSSKQQKKSVKVTPRNVQQSNQCFEIPILSGQLKQFQKEVLEPIYFYVSVYEANSLPKCILHKNIITLYCKNDHKPLCVSCLYSSQIHKNHQVVPLARAQAQIKNDFNQSYFWSKKSQKDIEELIKRNQINARSTEEIYPKMMQKLNNFYTSLHQMVAEKKSEQLQQIYENWSRLRYTYDTTKKQLQKISDFMKKQFHSMSERCQIEQLIHYRCITGQLSKVNSIITVDVAQGQGNRFSVDFERFQKLSKNLQKELNFTNLYHFDQQTKKITLINRDKANKDKKIKIIEDRSKSKLKSEASPHAKQSRGESPRFFTARRLSKNRHSKSDLIRKRQHEQRKRSKEKDSLKKKNQSFLNKLKQQKKRKSEKQMMNSDSITKDHQKQHQTPKGKEIDKKISKQIVQKETKMKKIFTSS